MAVSRDGVRVARPSRRAYYPRGAGARRPPDAVFSESALRLARAASISGGAAVVQLLPGRYQLERAISLPDGALPVSLKTDDAGLGIDAFPPVYVATDASATENFAAETLRNYLGNMTVNAVHLHVGRKPPAGAVIAVGYGAATALGLHASTLTDLKNDSYVISSTKPGIPAGSYVVTGGERSARGSLFAVYDFLRKLGCKFLAPDFTMAEELPALPPTGIPALDVTYHPSWEYRDSNEWTAAGKVADGGLGPGTEWAGKLGYNGRSAHSNAPGVMSTNYAHAACATCSGFVHTSYQLLAAGSVISNCTDADACPPPELWKTNRAWFWPRSNPSVYGQLCWSNRSLIAFLTKQVKKVLRANPDTTIISVSQNDNGNYCNDSAEFAINQEEGTAGGAMFRAVNTIADNIADEFPNIAVDTLAYEWSRPAPKISRPRPNVIIRLCTGVLHGCRYAATGGTECKFTAPLSDRANGPQNDGSDFHHDIDAWSAISDRLFIWNYVTSFRVGGYLTPFPNWMTVGPDLQYLSSKGVVGIFEEGSYSTPGGDMDTMKDFVIGRLLWNNSLNANDMIAEFLPGYFGKSAAPFIRRYMSTFIDSIANTNDGYIKIGCHWNNSFLTPRALLTGGTAFKNASTVAKLQYRARVEAAKISVTFVVLLRWDEIWAFAQREKIAWPWEATKGAAWVEFSRVWCASNILIVFSIFVLRLSLTNSCVPCEGQRSGSSRLRVVGVERRMG
jgi:hypothetical protein